MVASLLQILIGFSGIIGFLMRFIGPLTIAPTVSLIGLSLYDSAGAKTGSHWGISAMYVTTFCHGECLLAQLERNCFYCVNRQYWAADLALTFFLKRSQSKITLQTRLDMTTQIFLQRRSCLHRPVSNMRSVSNLLIIMLMTVLLIHAGPQC